MYILASWGRFYVSISDHFGTPKIAKFAPWCSPFQFGTIYSRRFNISLFPFHLSTYFYFDICTCCWFLVQYLSISISFPLTHSSVNFYHNLDVGNTFLYLFISIFDLSQFPSHCPLIVPAAQYRAARLLCLNWMWIPLQRGDRSNVSMFRHICCCQQSPRCQFFLLASTAHCS